MSLFLVAMGGGFIGSFHCMGMCGGFACGLAHTRQQNRSLLLVKSLSYNSGRLVSYVFIGALAGAFGAAVTGQLPPVSTSSMVFNGALGIGQRILSFTAGVLMMGVGLQLVGLRHPVPASWGKIGGITFARALRSLLASERPSASLALGVANGFLPCPLVYAFAASAAASASVAAGVMTMLGFALGTFPAMLFMSGLGLRLSPLVRQRGALLGGIFILLVGTITLLRGLLPGMSH